MEYKILKVLNKYFGNFNLLPSIYIDLDYDELTGKYHLAKIEMTDFKGYFYSNEIIEGQELRLLTEMVNKYGKDNYITVSLLDRKNDIFRVKLENNENNFSENEIIDIIVANLTEL